MDIQRIITLLRQEAKLSAKNSLAVIVFVMPLVVTLLISLVFGDLFAQTPRLGIYDAGNNDSFTQSLYDHESINTTRYESEAELETAVERGSVEIGLSLPADFATAISSDSAEVTYTIYRWGEAGTRSLLLLESVLARTFVDATPIGELPVTVRANQLGQANTATWAQRLTPLLLIMSTVLGGLFIPAASLIEEKQRRTLVALTTTPASFMDVYIAKVAFGVIISGIMAILFLLLNRAFNGPIGLLLFVIGLAGLVSSLAGMMMGSYAKDMDSFMAMIKAMGILLYAPGILELFPQVPAWIGRIFPTYYIMNPLMEITQNSAGLLDIGTDVAVLLGMIGVLIFALTRTIEQQRQKLSVA